MNPCRRCNGFGEIVVASHDLGGGAFNDDFDTCPSCHGNGTEPTALQRAIDQTK